jgi:hypothetical protein
MNPFDQSWILLKRISARANMMEHFPSDLDYTGVNNYLMGAQDSTLSDLVGPYLQGQLTADTGMNQPMTTDPRSYQEVQTPFPMREDEVQRITGMMNEPFRETDSGGVSGIKGGGTVSDDKIRDFNILNNAVRVLSGRLRGRDDVEFKPQRVENPQKGRTRRAQNAKLRALLDTPVKPVLATLADSLPVGQQVAVA